MAVSHVLGKDLVDRVLLRGTWYSSHFERIKACLERRLSLREKERKENANILKMQIISRLGFHIMLPFLPLVLDFKIKTGLIFYFFFQLCIVFILSGISKKSNIKIPVKCEKA